MYLHTIYSWNEDSSHLARDFPTIYQSSLEQLHKIVTSTNITCIGLTGNRKLFTLSLKSLKTKFNCNVLRQNIIISVSNVRLCLLQSSVLQTDVVVKQEEGTLPVGCEIQDLLFVLTPPPHVTEHKSLKDHEENAEHRWVLHGRF